jgi:hypothetical protein
VSHVLVVIGGGLWVVGIGGWNLDGRMEWKAWVVVYGEIMVFHLHF